MSSVENLTKFLHLYLELKYRKQIDSKKTLNELLKLALDIDESILLEMPDDTVNIIIKDLNDLCTQFKKLELDEEKIKFFTFNFSPKAITFNREQILFL